ncbi:hypothetical protein A2Y85_03900 [candidate division WOR-3 bacterium RBG_13_43_14]|uniref:PKD domain-containing protein n=1 Tax=candidate division WOR-3 bacterium RBG_13_43_14 TaxID=1802590 RepID=A0A1F4UAY3_UNCW3|nr:MAG: hypothetical protein A2Y85_03900 [candidate division WOR-3 bacterium RBG_13_43_14]
MINATRLRSVLENTIFPVINALLIMAIISCSSNSAPDIPSIPSGLESGDAGNYSFSSSATDPDNDSIAIRFDWGDGAISNWSYYVASSETVSLTHNFSSAGIYEIRAQAYDQKEAESEWSDPHTLTVLSGGILWEKTFGGDREDYGYSVVENLSQHRYITVGRSRSAGNGGYDVYLFAVDTNGTQAWQLYFGGPVDDGAYDICKTNDGGYAITGYTFSYGVGGCDVYIIKTNDYGVLDWQTSCGGLNDEYGWDIEQTSDGGYIIVGYTNSFGNGGQDVYIIKLNSSGDTTWTKTIGGIDSDFAYGVEQTSDGGYIIAGTTYSFGAGNSDIYLIKLGANGDSLWAKTLGTSAADRGNDIAISGDGGYIIAGDNGNNVYIVKTDASGNISWQEEYGGSGTDYAYSIKPTSDGGYIITGASNSFSGSYYDTYLIKISATGDSLWARVSNLVHNDYGYDVIQTNDGGYTAVGYAYTLFDYDFSMIRLAP